MKAFKSLFITTHLLLTSSFSILKADETSKVRENVISQAQECVKNTAMEWNSSVNRCVLKKQSHEVRNDAQACANLESVAAREKCHMNLAEKETGLSSDTGKIKGNSTKSLLINSAGAAASVFALATASEGTNSCTSAKILAAASIGGLVSEIYIIMKSRKKIKELEDKYKLDTIESAHAAQISAFNYLKEEQEAVKEMASLEKKRNMLLMAGYGIATVYAIYEKFTYGGICTPGNDTKTAEGLKNASKSAGLGTKAVALVGAGTAVSGASGGGKNDEPPQAAPPQK